MKRGTGALAGLEPARCCHHLILSHPRYFCICAHSCSYSQLQPHDIMVVLRNTPIHCIAALLMLNKGRYLYYAFARESDATETINPGKCPQAKPDTGKTGQCFRCGNA